MLSLLFTAGGSSMLFCGRYEINSRTMANASSSFSETNCATPDLAPCTLAPPRFSSLIVSPVTVLTTLGPVRNILLVPLFIRMKSVSAGEYTAPPAQGPMIIEICGTTPEALMLFSKIIE